MAESKISDNQLTGTLSAARFPSNSIIQVKYTQFTGTNSISCPTVTEAVFTDLTVSITPSSTSSIIKIEAGIMGEFDVTQVPFNFMFYFLRDSTFLGAPTAGNRTSGIQSPAPSYHLENTSTPESCYYSYFDSPSSTSSITYKVAGKNGWTANSTFYLNRTVNDADNSQHERGISFICATEIAG